MVAVPNTECFTNADAWIEYLYAGNQLAEVDVIKLCKKVLRED